MVEFCSQLVETQQVEKCIVADGSRVLVYMRTSEQPDAPGELRYHFSIGSVDAFERRLDNVQRQLGHDTFEFIPVTYRTDISPLSEVGRFIPVLLMIRE